METGPCGAPVAARHRPTLPASSACAPPAFTRSPGTIHCTLTHGLGTGPGRVKTQPATVNVSEAVTIGAPPAIARGLDGTIATVPPCGPSRRAPPVPQVPAIPPPPTPRS